MSVLKEEISAMESINERDEVRLDISSLAATIQERLKEAPQYSRRRCIYRVPKWFRQTNEQAYTPMLVSIGPLHHNDEKLLPMEVHKLKYLQSFLNNPHANADLLNSCLRIITRMETEIRECYADPIYLSSKDFTQMVLIDSVFIIEFFSRNMDSSPKEDDYIFGTPLFCDMVTRDIELEENQLPFFILDELYRAAFQTNASSSNSLMKIVCKGLNVNLDVNANVSETHYYHLLHLVARHRQPRTPQMATIANDEDLVFPTATQLHEAGVKFEANKESSSLFDIKFDRGILKMPKLIVDDNTECKCRNHIAFEQCNYGSDETRYFTDYHIFLNNLIDTPEDVQLLADAGIIKNLMGSHKQVADLINSLDTQTYGSSKGYYYEQESEELIGHCKKLCNRNRATLMHKYLNHPWAVISVVYAIVLLLLTIAQVVAGFMDS